MNLCFLFFLATVPITNARIPTYTHEDGELEKVSSVLELGNGNQIGKRKVFQIEKQNLTWDEHNELAKGKGCNLVSIHSEEDMKAVLEVTSKDQKYWIGGHRKPAPNRKTWYWTDGSPWDFTGWYDGEPNDVNGIESCDEVWHPRFNTKQWIDEPCLRKAMAIYYCPRPDFHVENQELSWSDHNKRAISQGYVLAAIHNQADWLDVLDIVTKNGFNYYWIGGKRKSPGSDTWVWSDGSPWDFTKWRPGQPDSKSNSENCVEVFNANNLWFDYYCNDVIPAIYMSKVSDEIKTW